MVFRLNRRRRRSAPTGFGEQNVGQRPQHSATGVQPTVALASEPKHVGSIGTCWGTARREKPTPQFMPHTPPRPQHELGEVDVIGAKIQRFRLVLAGNPSKRCNFNANRKNILKLIDADDQTIKLRRFKARKKKKGVL